LKGQALREIRHYQGTQGGQALLPWAPFARLVKEVAQDIEAKDRLPYSLHFQAQAIDALRTAAEDSIVCQFLGKPHPVIDV
jgi:histone H3/H4